MKHKEPLPPKREYIYAIANNRNNFEMMRSTWQHSLREARAFAEHIAKCFGKGTVVIDVFRADEPTLPLKRKKVK